MSRCVLAQMGGWMDEKESAEERVERAIDAARQDEVGEYDACVRVFV